MSINKTPLLSTDGQLLCFYQKDFISRFNELGQIMVSMSDLYLAGKSEDAELLVSLRKDFKDAWVISSTRIAYHREDLEATITHYFGSNVTSPTEEPRLVIPVYNGTALDEVLGSEQGLAYLQALFHTSDSAGEIKRTLNLLSSKSSGKTNIWTPDQGGRSSVPERAAGLIYYCDVFLVFGGSGIGLQGRSRGVNVRSALADAPENRTLSHQKASSPYRFTIHKKSRCVAQSLLQESERYARYEANFYFSQERYSLLLTLPKPLSFDSEEQEKNIAALLSEDHPTKEKLSALYQKISPLYAHLVRYQAQEDKFVLADDSEAFGEPRVRLSK